MFKTKKRQKIQNQNESKPVFTGLMTTMKTPKLCVKSKKSVVLIVNFEQISRSPHFGQLKFYVARDISQKKHVRCDGVDDTHFAIHICFLVCHNFDKKVV